MVMDNEYNADKFDLKLYNLISESDTYGFKDNRWTEISRQLLYVRPLVRAMMTEDARRDSE